MNSPEDKVWLDESAARLMWVGLIVMALVVVVFPVFQIYESPPPAEATEDLTAFLLAQGQDVFSGECSSCHGTEGRGGFGPAVGSRDYLESVDNDQLTQLIALGVPGTEMAAFSIAEGGETTSREIESVTAYLRSLEENAESNPMWQTPLAVQGLSGQDLYDLGCSGCHGTDRTGMDGAGPDLSPDSLAMEESYEFITGRITDGRGVMPPFGTVLSAEQIDLVVSFLRGTAVGGPATQPPTTGDDTNTTVPDETDADLLILGEEIFNVTAGGQGCAACHGVDGQGTPNGPNVIGSSKSVIFAATSGGIPDMDDIKLSREQLEAVYQYLQTLTP